jgi:hypothetical protein
MDARIKQLGLTLTIMLFLLSCIFANMEVVYSNNTYGEIDLFTQKEPYSGKGLNMPSDAFGLGTIVVLYALVTDDGVPLQDLLVTFYVESPNGASFSLTASTNASGIATITFTTPYTYVNETEVFGEWFTSASVLIGTKRFQDTLKFEVNWIVKLISVRTIDENLTYRTNFGIEGDVGLEIVLRNIAMQMKSTMLAIVIQDELSAAINFSEIRDFDVPPNERLVRLYCKLHIPKWAHIGKAKAFVSALTAPGDQGGVAYCPGTSTNFFITPYEPLTITFHDMAVVDVVPSAASVELGQPLNVSVMARNEGTEIENFNITAYCGPVFIGTSEVTALLPYSKVTLNFTLDTSSVDVGNYTINASIPYLNDEADFIDNTFVDGMVEIKPKLPIIVHDIAIVDVNISNNSVYIGDLLQINVSVVNKGTETETFSVRTCYDSSLIETVEVSTLASGAQVTLPFVWNTSFVLEGFYNINAYAPLPSDINALDNAYVNGVVHVKAKPTPPPFTIHDVAVLNVTPSSALIYIGETVDVCVVVKNQGNYTESFNVVASYGNNDIETKLVEKLEPNTEKTLVFHWNTQHVQEGNYTLSATANFVPEEVNLVNNLYIDGRVEVKAKPPELITHDVAVSTVCPYSNFTYVGEVLEIFVIVKNHGNATDSFNVTAFYDVYIVETLLVENLEPNSQRTLVFQWNTQNVAEGNYTLSALASQVPGEENLENNSYKDGIVTVVKAPMGWLVPYWFYWLLLLFLVLIIILLIAWYYSRKRRKRAEEAFYSGWTAWYYGCDMRKRTSKT